MIVKNLIMIYLLGITKAEKETSNKVTRLFKSLKIPFKDEVELEKFRFNREIKFNKNIYFMSKDTYMAIMK